MPGPSDRELIAEWRHREAPLLPLLHAAHRRDGYLSDGAVRAIAEGLGIPLADLYGTVTFYHHLSREPGGREAPRVCTGPVCALRGSEQAVDELSGAIGMPCSGRCDDPVPVLRGDETWRWRADGQGQGLEPAPHAPLPPRVPDSVRGGAGECVFLHIREPDRASLDGYRRTGGWTALESVVRTGSAEALLDTVDASGLTGRGGAGFPTGRKWRAVRDAPGHARTVVCNADEGEPGCFKDRVLMDRDPHALLEGLALACAATGAEDAFIYLRYEYPETEVRLSRALDEARDAGLLGSDVLGSGRAIRVHLRRGAGAYICGEETSLLNSLEGRHPFPRNRPPYPVTRGYRDTPTAVNNVETLSSVPPIVRNGAAWYRELGLNEHAGTKVISLSGDVTRPGNYEVPLGLPLRTLLDGWAGGVPGGRAVQAVTMAGLSGGFLAGEDLSVTLDEPAIRAKGSFLGAGGIMVFDETRDMVEVARRAMEFFAHESCGKCFPCRIGTQRLTERLAERPGRRPGGDGASGDLEGWLDEVRDLGRTMRATSACGLGQAAPLITDSLVRYFPEAVAHGDGHAAD